MGFCWEDVMCCGCYLGLLEFVGVRVNWGFGFVEVYWDFGVMGVIWCNESYLGFLEIG